MIDTLRLALEVIGLIYCAAVGLMMCCIYLIILIRLTDYATNPNN